MEEKQCTYSDYVEAREVLEKLLRNIKDPKKREALNTAIDAIDFRLSEY